MTGRRFVGLSSQQPVPSLLKTIRKPTVSKKMREVDVDAPPLSSSDLSDDGLPTKGNIPPSRFSSSYQGKSSPIRKTKDGEVRRNAPTPADRLKRARTSTRPASVVKPSSRPKDTDVRPEAIDTDDCTSSPISKKPKRSLPGSEELDTQSEQDIFAKKSVAGQRRYGNKSKRIVDNARQRASPARKFKRPPKESTPDLENPDRYKLKLPPSPSEPLEGPASPVRRFKAVPGRDLDSPADVSPVRTRRLRMPADDYPLLEDFENAEESQRPVFTIPDALPDSFIDHETDKLDLGGSQTADTSNASNLLRGSPSSPPTDPESIDTAPVCPFCRRKVDQEHLDEFNASNARTKIANMRKFCDQHKRRSAKETWVEKGYPDIDWDRLDDRIAEHYDVIRRILQDGGPSHYSDLFADAVRSGRNRTLLRSDANLTPGYYGIRGLQHITENLINEFAPVLRERAFEDRLIAARGQIMYLQSVLVPELAVRLVMEDMSVDEKEARVILTDSVDVGELLNDEIPDVVARDSDDDDED